MKRRDFSGVCGAAVAASALYMPLVQAQPKPPEAGVDYLVLDKRAPVETAAGKIEVVEFFWYNCPHCNAFEPALEAWIKRLPKDVSVRRVPVSFRDDFVPQQRLYYAIEAMGLTEKLHSKIFTAIHGEKLQLNKSDAIADWVAKQGVDKGKFLEQYNSFTVSTKATRATQLQLQRGGHGLRRQGHGEDIGLARRDEEGHRDHRDLPRARASLRSHLG